MRISESVFAVMSFWVYDKLSLQPRKVKQSQESIFDKWTITAEACSMIQVFIWILSSLMVCLMEMFSHLSEVKRLH